MKWIVRHKDVDKPMYETRLSSGMDLKADVLASIPIYPHSVAVVPTGLQVYLEDHEELQIRPRSGLAFKHGITVLNSPGTIDADYEGEIKVCLINHSDETYYISPKERIAQAVLSHVERAAPYIKDEDRVGGMGSTGQTDHHPV